MRPKRAILRLIVVSLPMALLVTIVTAWVIAVTSTPRIVRLASLSLANRVSPAPWQKPDGALASGQTLVGTHSKFGLDTRVYMTPEHPSAAVPLETIRWQRSFVFDIGWPCPALRGIRVEHGLPPEYALRHRHPAKPHALSVSYQGAVPMFGDTLLPMHVLWRGFLGNWLTYWVLVIIAWMPVLGIRWLIARRTGAVASTDL